ncbi:MAG: SHOCT domain-containing protein [Methanomassiliicoccus sp.]|nr:SHOCT domain-containing protein [Methanomassiliicoccus sp.]
MRKLDSRQGIFGLILALLLVVLLVIFVVIMVLAVLYGFALFLVYFPWLFVLIIVFLLIWWVFRTAFGWPHRRYYYNYYQYPYAPRTSSRTPEEVLDQRYARGEISRDEYLRMREDMRMGR